MRIVSPPTSSILIHGSTVVAPCKVACVSSILLVIYTVQWHLLQRPILDVWIWVHELILRVSVGHLGTRINHVLIIGHQVVVHLKIVQPSILIEILILIKNLTIGAVTSKQIIHWLSLI